MKSKTNANQKQTYTHRKNNSLVPKNKHTLTVRIANSSLVPKYSRKIAETDTINAYTNNEKKLKSSEGSRSFCSTCDTGDVTLVRNLVIRS